MKLHDSARHHCAGSCNIGSTFVHEQQHGGDEWRESACQLRSALRGDCAGAGCIQHETHSVGTRRHGGIHILFPGQAADFDSRALVGHGTGFRCEAMRVGCGGGFSRVVGGHGSQAKGGVL